LEALILFWTEVTIRAPESLSQAVLEIAKGMGWIAPKVEATTQAFFERCQSLRPDFFLGVLTSFIRSISKIAPATYASETASLLERFGGVLILDGSRLDAIRHRLKILWDQRAVILPGCITALYHLHQGIVLAFEFCADAAEGEIRRAERLIENALKAGRAAAGNLIVGDRYYCTAQFFKFLGERKLFGLARRNRHLKLRKVRRLGQGCSGRTRIEEWLVQTGASPQTPVVLLRWIRIQYPGHVFDVLTNVLDVQQLTAAEALLLYRQRWTVERLFYDLKVVLNLRRIYAANASAVAMQVYASAIVYTALRVAQSEIAQDAGISPDQISTQKFFPRFTAAAGHYWIAERTFLEVRASNRGVSLVKPAWTRTVWAVIPLREILCEPRGPDRRKRRFCKARRHWKSLAHVGAI
jgi:hypothetical protein